MKCSFAAALSLWLAAAVLLVCPLHGQVAETSTSGEQSSESLERIASPAAEDTFSADTKKKPFVYGINTSEGYRSSRDSDGASDGAVTLLNPYVGLISYKRRSEVDFQYSPLIVSFSQGGSGLYHRSQLIANVQLSHRWSWDFAAREGYGTEEARLLQNFEAALAAQRFKDTELSVYSSTRLRWNRTRREQVSLSLIDSHFSLQPENESSNIVSTRFNLDEQVGHSTSLGVFGQVHHVFESACTIYGAGIGIERSLGHTIGVSARAGPEYGSRECGQQWGLYYIGSLHWEPTERTNLTFSAKRDLDAAYLAGNGFADVVFGRIRQQTGGRAYLEMKGGYLRYSPNGQSALYAGYFVTPGCGWRVTKKADVVAGYYAFKRGAERASHSESPLKQNSFVVTLKLHSETGER